MAAPQNLTCDWKPECPRPPASGHHWCKEHKAEYQRTFRSTQEEMAAARNFQSGANALRYQLARMFARAPGSTFEGQSIAKYILEFPPPPYEDKKEPPTGAGGQGSKSNAE